MSFGTFLLIGAIVGLLAAGAYLWMRRSRASGGALGNLEDRAGYYNDSGAFTSGAIGYMATSGGDVEAAADPDPVTHAGERLSHSSSPPGEGLSHDSAPGESLTHDSSPALITSDSGGGG